MVLDPPGNEHYCIQKKCVDTKTLPDADTIKIIIIIFPSVPFQKKTFKINITPKLIKINGFRKQSCVLLCLKSYKVTFKIVNIAIN